jgi:CheY-like chemotaxis protein
MASGVLPDSKRAIAVDALDSVNSHATDVLLVESDDLIRFALRWLLSSDRRECVAVASAEEAQQVLAVHEPALVVTDLNLAGRWSGIDLLGWMWRRPRLRDVPMLLMTGDNPDGARSLLSAAGLDHVEILPKPFERVQLKERLALLTDRAGPDRRPEAGADTDAKAGPVREANSRQPAARYGRLPHEQ